MPKKSKTKNSTKTAAGVVGLITTVASLPGISDVVSAAISSHPKVAMYAGIAGALLSLFHNPKQQQPESFVATAGSR